jgi:hypothetical protein
MPLRGGFLSAGLFFILFGSTNILKHSDRSVFSVTDGFVRTQIVNDPRSVSNAGTVVYVFIESALYGIIAFFNCVFITFVYGFLLSFFEQYLYRIHDSFALLSCFASNAEEGEYRALCICAFTYSLFVSESFLGLSI